jgi:hypothetical protein
MSEQEETRAALELLLHEPEIVAWLDARPRPQADEAPEDDEPPQAA